MKFIDDLIVTLVLRVLRAVMAIGTGLMYVQFLALIFLVVIAGTVTLTFILAAAKSALLGG